MLAIAVIVGHTPELLDGNRSREPFTRLFGVLSLGEVAVDGFFLISGYLLTSSLLSNPSLRRYFVHRITRIYPGFLVAFFFCVFAAGFILRNLSLRLAGSKRSDMAGGAAKSDAHREYHNRNDFDFGIFKLVSR
jgi:peptidoglycan/LPS O-acetylase OafA/YrhL